LVDKCGLKLSNTIAIRHAVTILDPPLAALEAAQPAG
jgi:hypothetical protein